MTDRPFAISPNPTRKSATASTAITVVYCVERVFQVIRVVASACCFSDLVLAATSRRARSSVTDFRRERASCAARTLAASVRSAAGGRRPRRGSARSPSAAAGRAESPALPGAAAPAPDRVGDDVGAHRLHGRPCRRRVRCSTPSRLRPPEDGEPRSEDDEGRERERDVPPEPIASLRAVRPGAAPSARRVLGRAHARRTPS